MNNNNIFFKKLWLFIFIMNSIKVWIMIKNILLNIFAYTKKSMGPVTTCTQRI